MSTEIVAPEADKKRLSPWAGFRRMMMIAARFRQRAANIRFKMFRLKEHVRRTAWLRI
ncbi:hypothetical protein [Rhizobium johnstonii]|uniref:hypothetical protein n=1 Tax=Rhizobium johnstonii TaxID=3019933 RepID=UPI003F9EB00C